LGFDRWFEGLQQSKDELDRFLVPARRVVGELSDGGVELRNLRRLPFSVMVTDWPV
jgi:hypothetical protein